MIRWGRVLAAALLSVSLAAPAAADTPGLVDPASGEWHLYTKDFDRVLFTFGNPGDIPFVGDWDCDGDETPGLYRQSDGFVYLRNSNSTGIADIEFFFGDPNDVPIAGDFNGDGCDTVSIYRPSTQQFFIINKLGSKAAGLGAAELVYAFGDPGDKPFVGDFDGDGTETVGLHRESTGLVYFRNSHTQGNADAQFVFGDPDDRIMAGDWNGNGVSSPGLYRPSDLTTYLRFTNSQGPADTSFTFGEPDWVPVAGGFGTLSPIPLLRLESVGTFDRPVLVTAPAGDGRIFVVEQTGKIKVKSGASVSTFLDLSALSLCCGERGVLGLAFHPDYSSNGRFFVHYSDNSGDTVIAEYKVSGDPDVADPASARVVLTANQPASNHNGGMITFGPDGYLYIALGDGGGGGDPSGNGQNPNTLLGSLLRIDADGALPYAIPPTNPFVSGGGAPEVFAIGLRNPWRFSFDGQNIYIGDVGQDRWEEIDVISTADGGVNLGWNVMEGVHCYSPFSGCSTAGLMLPVVEYSHSSGGCSVAGGYVYRGIAMPGLAGTYFYGDLCLGNIKTFELVGNIATNHRDLTLELGTVPSLSSFGIDGAGELYVMSINGPVYKLVRR
ncbi:MAG: PQQ-dependent sugar dehydrogenase [Acidimicrobiia bacterium]|nr:PQQ-dependent sugar dehydrogenase [Acidimicrobiia bacterium]MDH3469737.1 PQQ-dependent sugar dehydrogenase [Acidimicrobiia bacterium]